LFFFKIVRIFFPVPFLPRPNPQPLSKANARHGSFTAIDRRCTDTNKNSTDRKQKITSVNKHESGRQITKTYSKILNRGRIKKIEKIII
jgi:hypothetical protein